MDGDHTQEQSDNSHGTAHLAPYQFKPGQSGNPGGRPKGKRITAALIDLIERHALDEPIAKVWIAKAMEGDPKFFSMLLDRVEGKVTDKIEVDQSSAPQVVAFVPENGRDAEPEPAAERTDRAETAGGAADGVPE